MAGTEASRSSEQKKSKEYTYAELERRYEQLVNRNPAGVYRVTMDGRFLECNEALVRILGYADRDELMKCSVAEMYFSPAERERFLTA